MGIGKFKDAVFLFFLLEPISFSKVFKGKIVQCIGNTLIDIAIYRPTTALTGFVTCTWLQYAIDNINGPDGGLYYLAHQYLPGWLCKAVPPAFTLFSPYQYRILERNCELLQIAFGNTHYFCNLLQGESW